MAISEVGVDFDYTYNGKLSTEVLFKPTVGTPAISDFFTIYPQLKYGTKIPLLLPLEKVVKKYTSCARTFTDGMNITNTEMTLTQLEVNMEWCKDDFEGLVGNVLAEDWLRSGVEEFNPEGTQIQRIIDEHVADAVRRDNFRIFSFGDTGAGSDDYSQLDGLWTTLIANSGEGGSYCVNKTSSLGTGNLADGAALAALEAAYTQSAIILKQMPDRYFAVTGSVYENLMKSYESNMNGTEKQFTNLVMGQDSLTYRGVPVIAVYAWDNDLQDTDNPLNGTVEHLILYTVKANHAVGVDVLADAEKISGWYERKDRRYYIEGFQRLGYNYIHCDLQSIAF